jgi:hypothetical protein
MSAPDTAGHRAPLCDVTDCPELIVRRVNVAGREHACCLSHAAEAEAAERDRVAFVAHQAEVDAAKAQITPEERAAIKARVDAAAAERKAKAKAEALAQVEAELAAEAAKVTP